MNNIKLTTCWVYGFFISLYFLTFGLFNSVFREYHREWNLLILVLSIAAMVMVILRWIFLRQTDNKDFNLDIIYLLIAIYITCLIFNFLFHYSALIRLQEPFLLNIRLMTPRSWIPANKQFLVYYLYFPVLFIFHRMLLKHCDIMIVIRIAAVTVLTSMGVLYYQEFIDTRFLAKWSLEASYIKPDGLATDPNSFVMCTILLLPVFVGSVFLFLHRFWRAAFSVLSIFYCVSVLFAGSRTGIVVLLLMTLSVPVIIAVSEAELNKYLRLALFAAPVVLFCLCVFLLPYIIEFMKTFSFGNGFRRLAITLDKIQEKNLVHGLIAGDYRIVQYIIGWLLLIKGPLGGWGPGGFYREFPNEYYMQTGELTVRNDSALNHYIMIAGDLGIPMLILNVLIILLPLYAIFKALKKTNKTQTRYVLSSLFTVQVIFLLTINTLPPSYFPDVIWIWTAIMASSLMVAQKAGIGFYIHTKPWCVSLVVAGMFILPNLFGIYSNTFGKNGYIERRDSLWNPLRLERNCHWPESWEQGIVRWCKKEARIKIPITVNNPFPEKIYLKVVLMHPDIQKRPVTVEYGGKSGTTTRMVVSDNRWRTLEISITEDDTVIIPALPDDREEKFRTFFEAQDNHFGGLYAEGIMRNFFFHGYKISPDWTPPEKGIHKYVILKLDVSRTWNPKKWGVNDDSRDLGLAVSIPQL